MLPLQRIPIHNPHSSSRELTPIPALDPVSSYRNLELNEAIHQVSEWWNRIDVETCSNLLRRGGLWREGDR